MSEFLSLETLASLPGPPETAGQTTNWHGHIPFARWIVRETRPSSFVELGVFQGDSYLTFCEAVSKSVQTTKCYGVDSWQGDDQAGTLAEDTYARLSAYHDPQYGSFSKLMKMFFDDALPSFADGSIDLLHIDGLHTYEAVKHDFETWLPKMSGRGAVLFHDSAVTTKDFGVYRLWGELAARYPSFEFRNSFGLGVLAVGSSPPAALKWLTSLPEDAQAQFRNLLSHMGSAIVSQSHLPPGPGGDYRYDPEAQDPLEMERRARAWDPWDRDAESIHRLDKLRAQVEEELAHVKQELASVYASTSWRITAPMRSLVERVRKNN